MTESEILSALVGSDDSRILPVLAVLEAGESPLTPAIVQRLVELLERSSKELRRRASGVLALAASSEGPRAEISRVLGASSADRRWGAAFALARSGVRGPEIFQAAVDAFAFDDGDIRWAALEIACDQAADLPDAVDILAGVARSALPKPSKMALYALRDLRAGTAEDFLMALANEDAGVRFAGLAGLGRIGTIDEDGIAAVIACMERDAVIGVRRASAAILGRVMGSSGLARTALERAARESSDEPLARAAKAALAGKESGPT